MPLLTSSMAVHAGNWDTALRRSCSTLSSIVSLPPDTLDHRSYIIGLRYNFYKLRDIAKNFDFEVIWNEEKQQVNINTSNKYEEETETTQNEYEPNGAGNNDKLTDAQAIQINSSLVGILQSSRDIDCYKFIAPTTGDIQVCLSSLPDKNRPVTMEIFDLAKNELPQISQTVSKGTNEIVVSSFGVEKGQTYHIRLSISDKSLYTNYILVVKTK